MKHYLRLFSAILLVWFISGCATPPYVEPQAGDTAKLAVVNGSDTPISVYTYKVAKDCSGGRFKLHKEKELIAGDRVEVKVRAGQEFSYGVFYYVSSYGGASICRVAGTFLPESDGDYVTEFRVDSNKCYLRIASNEDGKMKRVKSFRFRHGRNATFSQTESLCK